VPQELIGKTVTIKVQFNLAPVETISPPIEVKLESP
jgi:hypothetical protein